MPHQEKFKLSELILAGCKMSKKQAYGVFRDHIDGATCAIGAAAEALLGGMIWEESPGNEWLLHSSEIKSFVEQNILDPDFSTSCPACDIRQVSLLCVTIHLNDVHYWKRERIARWLAKKGL